MYSDVVQGTEAVLKGLEMVFVARQSLRRRSAEQAFEKIDRIADISNLSIDRFASAFESQRGQPTAIQ